MPRGSLTVMGGGSADDDVAGLGDLAFVSAAMMPSLNLVLDRRRALACLEPAECNKAICHEISHWKSPKEESPKLKNRA